MMRASETNLASPADVRRLLRGLGLRPRRALGQNFLVDRNILNILLSCASVSASDRVLEIGPGLGIVTEQLAVRARSVTAVEKDGRLAAYLQQQFEGHENVSILEADMLNVDAARLESGPVDKVVSNLPYSAGSRILVNFARMARPPPHLTVTVQKEVAGRLVAEPGAREYGLLSTWCGLAYEANLVRIVRPTCFWPRPDVSSAIVTMMARPPPDLDDAERTIFYKATRQAFNQRRKQMATVLPRIFPAATSDRARAAVLMEELGLRPTVRPQELAVSDWCRLARRLTSASGKLIRGVARGTRRGDRSTS